MTKLSFLKFLLFVGAGYFFVGAVAHFFGLSLFPWYVSTLYSPYHDILIALAVLIISMVLFTIAKNPVKNIAVLNTLILGGVVGIFFNLYILFGLNFTQSGAQEKIMQTWVESLLLVAYIICLVIFKPKTKRTE